MNKFAMTYMQMAKDFSKHSKDPNRKVGAVIARDNLPLSVGYNGLPRGLEYDQIDISDRNQKLLYVEHAERNAIFNASLNGITLKGAEIFVTAPPCADCMRAIIQSGIKRVYYISAPESIRWAESFKASLNMASKCGVEMVQIFDKIPASEAFKE